MEDIVIFEDFLTKDEMSFVDIYFKHDAKWRYGIANTGSDSITWFVCHQLKHEPFFKNHIVSKINKATNCNWECFDIYANGQTVQLEGKTHLDSIPPTEQWSALLYVSDINPHNIDTVNGHTEFKINNQIRSIEPFKNRLVLFKGSIPHKGRAPSIPEMFRISIIFKLKK
jgi:hypothetical protein